MRTAVALVVLLLVTACSVTRTGPPDAGETPGTPAGETPGTPAGEAPGTPAGPVAVATGLDVPWDLAFLPDGSALVTLRDRGEVLRIQLGAAPLSLGRIPGVAPGGEGGLLGIAVSPAFPVDGSVFVYFSTQSDNRVQRMRLEAEALVPAEVVLDGVPRAGNHNGGRIRFGPDGYLYVATGDAGRPQRAQDLASLAGKILRVDGDGAPAPGNPFPGSRVWSLGHRNVQGLAWDEQGRMYASEFGQNTWDELNRIEPGENYGWPVVEGVAGSVDFADPIAQWAPSEASPSGIAVADGAIYVAALRGQSLWRVPLEPGGAAATPHRLLEGTFGRLRAVEADAAGSLWLLTSNTFRGAPGPQDDRVLVVEPAAIATM